jgi:O-antigen ligase
MGLVALSALDFLHPSPFEPAAAAAAVLLALAGVRSARGSPAIVVLVLLFLAANLLSCLAGSVTAYSLGFLATTAYMAALMFVFSQIALRGRASAVRAFWLTYEAVAVAVGLLVILQLVAPGPLADLLLRQGRARGTFDDPNVYGAFLVPIAIAAFVASVEGWGWGRRLHWAAFLVIGLNVVLTFSRAAWGAAAAGIVVAALALSWRDLHRGRRVPARYWTGLALSSTVAAALVLGVVAAGEGDFLKQRAQLQSYDTDRFASQSENLQLFLEHPLGLGPGNSRDAVGLSPHNVFLRTASENGVFGVAALVGILLLSAWRSIQCAVRDPDDRTAIVLFAWVTTFCLHSLVIDSLHWRHVWMLLGLLWGTPLPRKVPRRRRQPWARAVERPASSA